MKTLLIVQARMGSERLPQKVMMSLNGTPIIEHVLKRCHEANEPEEVILATSVDAQNDELCRYVERIGYKVFRGEEENVLLRYFKCLQQNPADVIVRITGDCPLVDPQIIDQCIKSYRDSGVDYLRLDVPNTYYRGFDVEVFSYEALAKAIQEINEESMERKIPYQEHVTLYMYRNPDKFSIKVLSGDQAINDSIRLCVDTFEDFNVVKYVVDELGEDLSYGDVIGLIKKKPEIFKANSHVVQKKELES